MYVIYMLSEYCQGPFQDSRPGFSSGCYLLLMRARYSCVGLQLWTA